MPQRPGKNRNSTAISLRLEPKQRFALDLLARRQRRTMTSVIETALQRAIDDRESGLLVPIEDGSGKIQNILDVVWDTDEADRFVKLAMHWHDILGFNEQRMWKAIRENKNYFRGPASPNYQAIRQDWEVLKRESNIEE